MYTTQMDAARQHIITEEMKAVAAYEQMEEAEVCRLVAAGQVVIPANRHHTCRKSYGIGSMLKTKINVNLGTSRDCLDWTWRWKRYGMPCKWELRPLWI